MTTAPGNTTNVQRTAANIQNSHHKYMNESKHVLQKHIDTVQSLRQEREHLLRELGSTGLGGTMNLMDTVKSSGSIPSVGQNSSLDLRRKATQYTDELRILKIKLEAEQNRAQELDKNVAVLQGEQFATRAVMGGVNVRKENHLMFEKQMKVLENRLDQALVRFNDSIAHNKKLRETIDTLRREREVFNEIYQKLERELQEKKHLMSDTIEISNRCYETRDTYVNELERLKVQAQEELTVFNNKLRELDAEAAMILNKEAAIEAEREEAISRAKAQRVAATVAAAAGGATKLISGGTGNSHAAQGGAGGAAVAAAGTSTVTASGGSGAVGGVDASGATAGEAAKQHTATHYQEMLEQLREATGVQDLKKLQEKFRAVEESNFSMYNYIHGLHKEIESVEEEIESLQESLHSDKGDPATRRALQELELELAQTESVQVAYDGKNHVIRGQLDILRHTLQEIMVKVGCMATPSVSGMASNADSPRAAHTSGADGSVPIPDEISERNMHDFLALLERRTTELIHKQVAIQRRKQLEKSLVSEGPGGEAHPPRMSPRVGGKPMQWGDENEDTQTAVGSRPVPRGGTTPSIQQLITTHGLPSTGDGFGNDGGEDGEDDRVLSEKELRERIERRLSAKTQQEGGMERGERRRGKGTVNPGASGAGKYAK